MKLYLIGHDYRYAAEQILLMLFPDERPEYPEAPESGDGAVLTLRRGGTYATVTCRLTRGGAVYHGRAAVKTAALTDDVTADRLLSRAVSP